jgi:isocitrate dehydrogenase kinase/phosphatase
MKYHRDLLDVAFWQKTQEIILRGEYEDFFPYPESLRFCNCFRAAKPALEAVDI